LATDVVGLVGHADGDVGVRACGGEEDAEITDFGVVVEADDGEADDGEDCVEDEHRSTHSIAVSPPAGCDHLCTSQPLISISVRHKVKNLP
jgi:hypothetical protein